MPRRGIGLWFTVAVLIIKPLLRLTTRRERRGVEALRHGGGLILAANHYSVADPFTVAEVVYDAGRLPHFLAKQELFELFFVKSVLRGAQQIPVRRNTADASAALAAATAALRAGRVVVIYPEGTITRDPQRWPMQARTGVARLAADSGAPVLPLAQWGAQRLWEDRRGGGPLRRPVVRTVIGPPVPLDDLLGPDAPDPAGADRLRLATDRVMAAITAQLAELRDGTPPRTPFVPPPRAPRLDGGAPRPRWGRPQRRYRGRDQRPGSGPGRGSEPDRGNRSADDATAPGRGGAA